MNFSLYEEDGVYRFQIENLLYEYRIENKKTYKNEEFLTFLKNSAPNRVIMKSQAHHLMTQTACL